MNHDPDRPITLPEKPASSRRHFKRTLYFLWLLPILIASAARQLLVNQPALVEKYHTGLIFKGLSRPISVLTSLVSFSLTELLVVGGALFVVLLLVGRLYRLIRRLMGKPKVSRADSLRRFRRILFVFLYVLATAYLLFTLLHGLNYERLPVARSFGLAVEPRSTEDLLAATAQLARMASAARTECVEDENGIFRLRDGITGTLNQTSAGYAAASADWPLLAGPALRPKGVLLSHYWSYTGITGVYFPFLVEANVNIDQPEYAIPDTAGHEFAHMRGFAREDEAGFISFLAGLYNPNPDFRYSALANAYVRCANSLYAQSQEAYTQVAAKLVSDGMSRDLAQNSLYWHQFDGPVAEASEEINQFYLEANRQTDGVRSYGRMIDLVLAYFEKNEDRFPNGDR